MPQETYQSDVVKSKGLEILAFAQKTVIGSLISAGRYILEPRVLAQLSRDEHFSMPQLLQHLMNANEIVNAYPLNEA